MEGEPTSGGVTGLPDRVRSFPVPCPSGRRIMSRKHVWGQLHRGFKSHRYRHRRPPFTRGFSSFGQWLRCASDAPLELTDPCRGCLPSVPRSCAAKRKSSPLSPAWRTGTKLTAAPRCTEVENCARSRGNSARTITATGSDRLCTADQRDLQMTRHSTRPFANGTPEKSPRPTELGAHARHLVSTCG